MADTFIQGSFAFRCLPADCALLDETITALNAITKGDEPEPPGKRAAALFPPSRCEEPWSGLVDLMPDPDRPGINADFDWVIDPDDPHVATVYLSSMTDFEPGSIAELIHLCCQESLTLGPVGFEWAVTCSRPRIDEFGGGWCVIFADRIEFNRTGEALTRAMAG
jgi:hypothetical protein